MTRADEDGFEMPIARGAAADSGSEAGLRGDRIAATRARSQGFGAVAEELGVVLDKRFTVPVPVGGGRARWIGGSRRRAGSGRG